MSTKNSTAKKGLPEEVVVELCNRWKNGHDQMAFEKLLKAYMWVIELVINKYYKGNPNHVGLVHEGSIGIWDAVMDFDPGKGTFASNAYFKILGRMSAAAKEDYAVAIPKAEVKKRMRIEKARNRYECEHGMEPSYYELAELTGLKEEELYKYEFQPLGGICIDDYDLDQDVVSDNEVSIFGYESQSADSALIQSETEAALNQGLKCKLSERDAEIIELSFGMKGDNPEGLNNSQIAEIFKLCPARIGQIKGDAIEQLYKYMRCRA